MSESKYKNFTIDRDHLGIMTVSLSVVGRPMNVLDWSVMNELDQVIGEIETSSAARVVVFRSHKESGFLAGADVHGIAKIESPEEVRRLVAFGQGMFDRIERLAIPSVAVLHGPCLGGGLEWALACQHRVARNNSSTQIGLPEIKLGLIPGWGGTQRLPRWVGTHAALDLILRGRLIDAAEAQRIGLIDLAISPTNWDHDVDLFIKRLLEPGAQTSAISKRPFRTAKASWAARLRNRFILAMANRKTRAQQVHYPAIAAAIDAVAASMNPSVDGFMVERERFTELLATPTCRNLIDLFVARESARSPKTWIDDSSRSVSAYPPIQTIGIVGAGVMGAGIAQLAASRGFSVVVKEVDGSAVEAGRRRIRELFERQAKHKGKDSTEVTDLLSRVRVSSDAAALDDAELVVEAAVEKESVKQEIFRNLGRRTADSAILASNTSSLSIASLAMVTAWPHRVAGLHFFNPVHRMELVEVVAADQTDDETITRLVSLVRALGKTPIVAKDSPGIVVNRVLFPYLGEAVRMVAQGYPIDTIDSQLRQFGMPMGPLELLDQVGIDVALHVAGSLRDVLPDAESVVGPLAAMAEHDRLGKKQGLGFYHYSKGSRKGAAKLPPGVIKSGVIKSDGSASRAPDSAGGDDWLPDTLTSIQRRLVYPMLIESVRCLELGIVDHGWAIDLAMVLGTGFAPHRGGPLHMVDAIGRETLINNLAKLESIHGARFAPPRLLAEVFDLAVGIRKA